MRYSEIPIFFVVGRGRSGSTLLRSALNAHPEITVPYESRFVQYLYYKYHRMDAWDKEIALGAITSLQYSFEPPDIDMEKARQLIEDSQEKLTFELLCRIIYLSINTGHDNNKTACIGDKNPRYTFFIPHLLKIFPNALFIHLVRDYRANALAVARAASKIGEGASVISACSRWVYYNRQVEKYKRSYPQRFFTLRFEDLVQNPGLALKNICGFLQVGFNSEMLNYLNNPGNRVKAPAFDALHQSLLTPFDTSKITEWQQALSNKQVATCETVAGKYGLQYGYAPQIKPKASNWLLRLFMQPLIFWFQVKFRAAKILYRYPLLMVCFYRIKTRNL